MSARIRIALNDCSHVTRCLVLQAHKPDSCRDTVTGLQQEFLRAIFIQIGERRPKNLRERAQFGKFIGPHKLHSVTAIFPSKERP